MFAARNRSAGVVELRQAESDATVDEKTSRTLAGIVIIAMVEDTLRQLREPRREQ